MQWMLRNSVSVSATILVVSLMFTITGFGFVYAVNESINVTNRAFPPRFLELKDGDMKGLGEEQLRILAKAGFGEARRLSKAYRQRGTDQQDYMDLLVWVMFVQVVCLSSMFFVVYQSKKSVA